MQTLLLLSAKPRVQVVKDFTGSLEGFSVAAM